jgi:hypothetical protein
VARVHAIGRLSEKAPGRLRGRGLWAVHYYFGSIERAAVSASVEVLGRLAQALRVVPAN